MHKDVHIFSFKKIKFYLFHMHMYILLYVVFRDISRFCVF